MTKWRLWRAACWGLAVQVPFTLAAGGWQAFRPLIHPFDPDFTFALGRVAAMPLIFTLVAAIRNAVLALMRRKRSV
jgi:hypothetical protein